MAFHDYVVVIVEPGFGNDSDVDLRVGQELIEELSFVGNGPGVRGGNDRETVSKGRSEDRGFGAQWCWVRSRRRVGGCGGN